MGKALDRINRGQRRSRRVYVPLEHPLIRFTLQIVLELLNYRAKCFQIQRFHTWPRFSSRKKNQLRTHQGATDSALLDGLPAHATAPHGFVENVSLSLPPSK